MRPSSTFSTRFSYVCEHSIVKAAFEFPDAIHRRAKSNAAARGVTLSQFVAEAIEEKLGLSNTKEEKPWLKHLGKLKHLRKETARINRLIEEDSEKIDPEMWR